MVVDLVVAYVKMCLWLLDLGDSKKGCGFGGTGSASRLLPSPFTSRHDASSSVSLSVCRPDDDISSVIASLSISGFRAPLPIAYLHPFVARTLLSVNELKLGLPLAASSLWDKTMLLVGMVTGQKEGKQKRCCVA